MTNDAAQATSATEEDTREEFTVVTLQPHHEFLTAVARADNQCRAGADRQAHRNRPSTSNRLWRPPPTSVEAMSDGRTKVLIIGGGFGGLFCARRLGHADVDVTLLDRAAGHLFQPLLYQCATGTLSIGHISRPLREQFARDRNVTTLLGEAIELDPEARTVTALRPDETRFTVYYDVLIIAAGMQQSYMGNEHFAQWAPGMKTLDDALSIRQRLFTAFEIAETLPPGPERDSWLTFAVAGGGPTGVELAGQIREMASRTLANEFHSIEPEEARVLLFDGGDHVLKSFAPDYPARPPRHCGGLALRCAWVCTSPTSTVRGSPSARRRAARTSSIRRVPCCGRPALRRFRSRDTSPRCWGLRPTAPVASR